MNTEIFAALRQLEKERGIPVDYMVERITQAIAKEVEAQNDQADQKSRNKQQIRVSVQSVDRLTGQTSQRRHRHCYSKA